jgi:hypothetical protein
MDKRKLQDRVPEEQRKQAPEKKRRRLLGPDQSNLRQTTLDSYGWGKSNASDAGSQQGKRKLEQQVSETKKRARPDHGDPRQRTLDRFLNKPDIPNAGSQQQGKGTSQRESARSVAEATVDGAMETLRCLGLQRSGLDQGSGTFGREMNKRDNASELALKGKGLAMESPVTGHMDQSAESDSDAELRQNQEKAGWKYAQWLAKQEEEQLVRDHVELLKKCGSSLERVSPSSEMAMEGGSQQDWSLESRQTERSADSILLRASDKDDPFSDGEAGAGMDWRESIEKRRRSDQKLYASRMLKIAQEKLEIYLRDPKYLSTQEIRDVGLKLSKQLDAIRKRCFALTDRGKEGESMQPLDLMASFDGQGNITEQDAKKLFTTIKEYQKKILEQFKDYFDSLRGGREFKEFKSQIDQSLEQKEKNIEAYKAEIEARELGHFLFLKDINGFTWRHTTFAVAYLQNPRTKEIESFVSVNEGVEANKSVKRVIKEYKKQYPNKRLIRVRSKEPKKNHAERLLLGYAKKYQLKIMGIGASRPFCSSCCELLEELVDQKALGQILYDGRGREKSPEHWGRSGAREGSKRRRVNGELDDKDMYLSDSGEEMVSTMGGISNKDQRFLSIDNGDQNEAIAPFPTRSPDFHDPRTSHDIQWESQQVAPPSFPISLKFDTITEQQLQYYTVKNVKEAKKNFLAWIKRNENKLIEKVKGEGIKKLENKVLMDIEQLHRFMEEKNVENAWNLMSKIKDNAEKFKQDTDLDPYSTVLRKLIFVRTKDEITGLNIKEDQLQYYTVKDIEKQKHTISSVIRNVKNSVDKKCKEVILDKSVNNAIKNFNQLFKYMKSKRNRENAWNHIKNMREEYEVNFRRDTGLDAYRTALRTLTFVKAKNKVTGLNITKEQLQHHTIKNVIKQKILFSKEIINNKNRTEKKIEGETLKKLVGEAKMHFELLHHSMEEGNIEKAWKIIRRMRRKYAEEFKNATGLDTYHTALRRLIFIEATNEITGLNITKEQLQCCTIESIRKQNDAISKAKGRNNKKNINEKIKGEINKSVNKALNDFKRLYNLMEEKNIKEAWGLIKQMREKYAEEFKEATGLPTYRTALRNLIFVEAKKEVTGLNITKEQLQYCTIQNISEATDRFSNIIRSNAKKTKGKIKEEELDKLVNKAKENFVQLRSFIKGGNIKEAWDHIIKMREEYEVNFRKATGLDTYRTALRNLIFVEATNEITGSNIKQE